MRFAAGIRRFARDEDGVAAIDMAIIVPVLLLLFIGTIDLTGLLSDNRRVSYSAQVAADILTRLPSPTTPGDVGDSFEAVGHVMNAALAGPARVEAYNYRMVNGAVARIWDLDNGAGAACDPPDEANLDDLMDQGNDVLIVVVCVTHRPIVTTILGENFLGAPEFTLRRQTAMRPRDSLTLDCPDC